MALAADRPVSGVIAKIFIAREFNQLLGGALVAPWEVDELSEEWHTARVALRADLPQMQTANQRIDEMKARIRMEHQRR